MAAIAFNQFGGEIPAITPSLLPENYAQKAINCDFTQGILSPLKQGFLLGTFSSTNPVKSLYTEDGIYFFTWTTEAYPFKSPVIDDSYARVYFLNSTTASVTTYVPNSTVFTTGGPPSTSVALGVPTPTVAPIISLSNRDNFYDYPNATLAFSYWYEFNGAQYDKATVIATTVIPLVQYDVTVGDRSSTTDPTATLVVQVIASNAGTTLFAVTTSNTNSPTVSNALPGGFEVTLTHLTGFTYAVNFSWGVVETRAYTYTVRNTWSEESAPAPPSIVSPTYIQDVYITTTIPSFVGYQPYQDTNIYRTFGSSADYLKVAITVSPSLIESSQSPSSISTGLISTDFVPPPTGLSGFGIAPNGICWAFKNNTIYLSEPFRPHAWPYSQSFPRAIRGVCVGSDSIVVTTADFSYILRGSHPASMQQSLLPAPQAGIATRSMTKVDGGVVFASHDGMVMVQGSQATLGFSHNYFNRDDWRARYGTILSNADMRFNFHDGFLVATSPDALGFIVRTDEARNTYTQYNQAIDSTFQIPLLDTLYYSQGASVYQFRGGPSYHTFDWQSKDFIFPSPINFAIGYIRCSGPVTITLYADGVQYPNNTYTTVMNSTGYFRIPAALRAVRWSVELQSSYSVYEFYIASSQTELRRV